MKSRTWCIPACLVLAVILALSLLLFGGDWNEPLVPLVTIPIGNPAAWVAFIAVGLLGWRVCRGTPLRWPAVVVAALALAWLPVSMLLFGNVYLSNAGDWQLWLWFRYTALLVVGPLLLMMLAAIARVRRRMRARRLAG